MLILIMGLPGSGKSYFARHFSQKLKFQYIGSDETRKKMEARGKYRKEDKQEVYDQMESLAAEAIEQGRDVIVDATFFKEKLRGQFISLAIDKGVPYCIFWIEAPEGIIKDRLSSKREDSEADYEVYLKLSQQFEEPILPCLKLWSLQDNINEMVNQAEEYLQHQS